MYIMMPLGFGGLISPQRSSNLTGTHSDTIVVSSAFLICSLINLAKTKTGLFTSTNKTTGVGRPIRQLYYIYDPTELDKKLYGPIRADHGVAAA
jgi:hypothetical protein